MTSFVNPERVPQMADADEVAARLPRGAARYIGLALNMKGFERAVAAGLDEVNFVIVASDTFSHRNQGDGHRGRASPRLGRDARGGRDGRIAAGADHRRVVRLPVRGRDSGVAPAACGRGRDDDMRPAEMALADTIGVATPADVAERVAAVSAAFPGMCASGLHLHNTRNTGIANAWAGVMAGAVALDSSLGGVGGCPFAPRATGNIATEDLVYMLERSGVRDRRAILTAASTRPNGSRRSLGHVVPGMVMKAGGFPPRRRRDARRGRPPGQRRRHAPIWRFATDILDGVLAADERLTEVTLAERLGISRTPVREAVKRLLIEGFLTRAPGEGLRVTGLNPDEIAADLPHPD